MKLVKVLVGVVVLIVGGVAMAASTQPDQLHVERQIEVSAAVVDVEPYVNDVKKINEWSPWNELDPSMKQEFSEPTSGVGAWYSWAGNDEVGSGKASIKSVAPGKVVTALEFYAPMEGVAESAVTYSQADDLVVVVWSYDQQSDFAGKIASLFMDLDAMIGDSYLKGLGKLKVLAEKAAAQRNAKAEQLAEAQAKAEDAAAAEPPPGEAQP